MSTQDERYAQVLRERAAAVVPAVEVDVDRVVPRARRRRAVVRGGFTAGTLALVLGVGSLAGSALGGAAPQPIPPAGTSGAEPPAASEPVAPSVPTRRPTVPGVAVIAADGTVTGVPGDPWDGDAKYWYQLTEASYPAWQDGVLMPPETQRGESWRSRERPGLLVSDGDLEAAMGTGPSVVLGTWVVAGQRHEMLTDPTVLPTDGDELAQVVRDSLEEGRGAGTDDDKVYEVVRTALREGGLWAEDLRSALWAVAASLPGAEVGQGEDGLGRAGEVLRYRDSAGELHQLVRDASGLLLEDSSPEEGSYTRYLEQRPVDDVPVEPTVETTGCFDWATC
ncbi:hypothetical protein [Cellulomonas xiejunii]|uniref:Uncharacterized protein n=1 Tax=Cellulomonas xiejunii TaxID=2968083 RepID=A0ABY5KMH5_9CELL|nr:hypothetical protein [Cellulomonas xiejunii]MCC2320346.1 hypothetical protein [Cellulomonas xiejunii]UUI70646.1 hypothetical protein NP048_12675 [Cellulomonas xiejunii]